MKERIDRLAKEFTHALNEVASLKELEDLKVRYLGRKGELACLMQNLKDVPSDQKPTAGKWINDLKNEVASALDHKETELKKRELEKRIDLEKIDVTLPGRRRFLGKPHVLQKVMDEAIAILTQMGFSVQYGPDIDSDYYNFEALNFAKDHPARDMQDTFYLSSSMVLRTHTSNTQVRVMENSQPPIRVIMPGTCYRNEDVSARSHVVFHQIEGLYIDKEVSFADLLTTLEQFYERFFGKEVEMRFRPSYFPFVEPGVEVDISCITCNKAGCNLCKKTGWLEVCGAGMVHPEVMKAGGIDPEKYSGYAWGGGVERLAMLKYGIKDIRLFFENNVSFLQQF